MATNYSATGPIPSQSHIYFRYQAHSISLEQWIQLITVCLAPIVTHIAFGFAEPVLLSSQRPKWHDKLIFFCPISIVWRWYAILRRRARAHSWDQADMAATNAIFWTGRRWDGSEELMVESRRWATKLPTQTHVGILSASTLATLVMTIQGIGAAVRMVYTAGESWQSPGYSLPNIFYPIALLSISRLPASPWLSSEYGFLAHMQLPTPRREMLNGYEPIQLTEVSRGTASKDRTECHNISSFDRSLGSRLRPNTSVQAHWCTVFGVVLVLGVCGPGVYLSVTGIGPKAFVVITSSSSLCASIFYFTLSLSGGCFMLYHIFKCKDGSTIIPCMNSWWYKGLIILLMLEAVALFGFTALETTVLPNGSVETYWVPPPTN